MGMILPARIAHTKVLEEHGKIVFHETYEDQWGRFSEWLLFGVAKVPVVVFPIDTEGHVIAVEHFRYGANALVLEIPGGAIDKNETPQVAAIRELKEETGYDVCSSSLCALVDENQRGIWLDPASLRMRFLPFLALNCRLSKDGPKPDSEEYIAPKYDLGVRDWYSDIMAGKIIDSKTVAVSLLALNKLPPDLKKEAAAGLGLC